MFSFLLRSCCTQISSSIVDSVSLLNHFRKKSMENIRIVGKRTKCFTGVMLTSLYLDLSRSKVERVAAFLSFFFFFKRPFRSCAWEALVSFLNSIVFQLPPFLEHPPVRSHFFKAFLTVSCTCARTQRAVTESLSSQHWILATPLCSLAKAASWERVPQHLRVCCCVTGKSERGQENVS